MRAFPGFAVIEPEEKTKEGALTLPDTAKADMQRGTIIEVNAEYYKDGKAILHPAQVGMKVVFKRYHDQKVELEGKNYLVVPVEHLMLEI